MIRLATVIETFEGDLRAQYGDRLLPSHHRALAAMSTCRSALSPRMQVQCEDCAEQRLVPHSCGHRACPHCQHHESQQWLERQLQRRVPADYFLLTFSKRPGNPRSLSYRTGAGIFRSSGVSRCGRRASMSS